MSTYQIRRCRAVASSYKRVGLRPSEESPVSTADSVRFPPGHPMNVADPGRVSDYLQREGLHSVR